MFCVSINILNSDYFSKNWTSRTCQNCFWGEGARRGEMLSRWSELVRPSRRDPHETEHEPRGIRQPPERRDCGMNSMELLPLRRFCT
jgi:hypothetical protein